MITNLKALLSCATAVATLATVATATTAISMTGCASDEEAGCPAACPAACPASCPAPAGDAQTPPQGTDAVIEAWLAAESYLGAGWTCETDVHEARFPSPHGMNRVCNNTALTNTAAPALYSFGVASVKEFYDDDGVTLIGHATSLKLQEGASDGSKWYFFETLNGTTIANGTGEMNNSDLCSGCHAGAGSDASHPGRDFVYTQVPAGS